MFFPFGKVVASRLGCLFLPIHLFIHSSPPCTKRSLLHWKVATVRIHLR